MARPAWRFIASGIPVRPITVTTNALTAPSILRGVELISYGGTNYYAGRFNGNFGGSYSVPYHDVWFTNSTIFCISPDVNNYVYVPCR
jgi:hypothetical protein